MKKGEGKTESQEITGRRNKEKERDRKEGQDSRGKGTRRKQEKGQERREGESWKGTGQRSVGEG
jgi:hypothetical protein